MTFEDNYIDIRLSTSSPISIRRFSMAGMVPSSIISVKSTHVIHPEGYACKNRLSEVKNSTSLGSFVEGKMMWTGKIHHQQLLPAARNC
ncbi:MAG: hypothetical protein EZS28_042479 [Streblomastix strix]|uniref:Uncharacterized protein n=1 Tax=Streblomastix strix TaxID=222440 RepID=A0A5J4TUQ4_9EUKA|nr:MAG: hypothetical protein EZS28_042479 [Streblomastix strix]